MATLVAAVENDGDVCGVVQLFEKTAADRGLPGADVTAQQDETVTATGRAVVEVFQRRAMTLAQIDKARVWGDRKRMFSETEVLLVCVRGAHKNPDFKRLRS